MKYIYKIIFLSFLVFSTNLILTNDSKAACAVDANGAITVVAAIAGCEDEPTSYGVTIFKLLLCTANPTAPTIAAVADLSDCTIAFENSTGSAVDLSPGASLNLGGTQTLPSIGVYTHGVVQMNNTFEITAKKEFEIAFDGLGAGGAPNGNGVFCATITAADSAETGVAATDRSVCGNNTITAGTLTETLTSFDSGIGAAFDANATVNNVGGTGADITAYLIDTNEFLAFNDADVDNLLGVVEFANPTNITAATTNIDISFFVTEGMSVNSGGVQIFLGSGPFGAIVTAN
jgi:hypothetical protein